MAHCTNITHLFIFHRVLHIVLIRRRPLFYSIILLWSAKKISCLSPRIKNRRHWLRKAHFLSFLRAPLFFPRHFKCALCPQEERRVKNAFLNDTLASELLKILFAIALLPEFEVFNFCLMLVAWNFAWVWTLSPFLLIFLRLFAERVALSIPSNRSGCFGLVKIFCCCC